jgi:hypothetical protein
MKTRALSIILAAVTAAQTTAWAQSSRTDGIGDQQIARAQHEMTIIRHDLERLQTSLSETESALRERKSQGHLTNMVAVSTATVGLGLAALAATAQIASGEKAAPLIAVQAALSAVAGYLNYRETRELPTESADKAVNKARQEILAARASNPDSAESMDTLTTLDESLQFMQTALQDYRTQKTLKRRIQLAGTVSQTAGAAMSFAAAFGILNRRAVLNQILMASGNIAMIVHGLAPEKTDQVLAEIVQTQVAVKAALENL